MAKPTMELVEEYGELLFEHGRERMRDGDYRYYDKATALLSEIRQRIEAMEWIPVGRRLPDIGVAVLCGCWFDGPHDWRAKVGAYQPGHEKSFHDFIIPSASWKPTHWMPLPAAPTIDAAMAEGEGEG